MSFARDLETIFARDKIAFIKALDALIDYHHLRGPMTTQVLPQASPIAAPKKPNRFVSFLKHIGHDLKVGLPTAVKVLETVGETAVAILAPGASALFNQTVASIATAEQNYPATGTGPQKSAAVIAIMGQLIKQGLADAGLSSDDAAVQKYIDAAVLIAKVTPVGVFDEAATATVSPMAGPQVTVPIPVGDTNLEVLTMPRAPVPIVVSSGPSAVESILGE